MKWMKCPKCGGDATLFDEVTFHLDLVEDGTRAWGLKAVFQRYIHFKWPEAKTPNFVFYIEKEEEP